MQKALSCIPTKRTEEWWLKRHDEKIGERCKLNNQVDLLLLGDSIVHAWELEGEPAWHKYFAHSSVLNLGFAGDRTEHLLWRIQQSKLDTLNAKNIVLLVGTNNAGHRHDTPQEIALGIESILDSIQALMPASRIILTAIFPRSRNPKKRMRKLVDATNNIIQSYANNKSIIWFDINERFLDDDGILDESKMPDLLHPNEQQYHVWAEALSEVLSTATLLESTKK